MSDGLRVEVKGIKEAVIALQQLPKRLHNKHMRIAMNAGAGIIKPTAKSLAPRGDSGLLQKSLTIKVKRNKQGEWFAAIGPKRGMKKTKTRSGVIKTIRKRSRREKQTKVYDPARYAHLVEGGTKRHEVRAANKKVLATIVDGMWVSYARRSFVAAKANPFMRKSAAISGQAAANKAVSKLQEGIAKEAAALSRT